ncbi:MAG: hypothetical protein BJ554DRAFT_3417 [Olpidium bornovanus]|uniref:Uncharacterized protein n=1 Tax=Olpidium bornovanus TaxID=278681 RepID=A0A8H7ZP44_9FUNG|nr:MAG: hypothetical protein BJ554DRAFT_3417 [Olpidium bornovanus]
MYHRLLKLHAGAHALAEAASAAGGSPAALRRAAAATAAPPPRRASTAGPGAQVGDPGPLQETRALHTARRRPVASARTVCPPSSHRPRGDPAGVASSAPARRAAAVDAGARVLREGRVVVDLLERSRRTGPKKALFDKILVANRGEIAIRVMKTAKRLGVKTVAVYSEADKEALHVKMVRRRSVPPGSRRVGGKLPAHRQNHRRGKAEWCTGDSSRVWIFVRKPDVCEQAGGGRHNVHRPAGVCHRGHGIKEVGRRFGQFQYERLYASEEGLPSPSDLETRRPSWPSESKRVMIAAGVPCVPGYHGTNQDPCFLKAEADKIGYPVLIKAVKGGGGKGMRIVEGPESFDEMLTSSRREAIKSFGDDNV